MTAPRSVPDPKKGTPKRRRSKVVRVINTRRLRRLAERWTGRR